jgi:dynein heavy chain
MEDFLFTVDNGVDITSVFVPTVDSLKMQYFLSALGRCGRAVLLIGEPGTSKTSLLCDYLQNIKSDVSVSKVVNFSVSTTPLMFQASIS